MRIALLFLLGCLLLSSCTEKKQPQEIKDTQTAVGKVYDTTTNTLREVVEGVNNAVYK